MTASTSPAQDGAWHELVEVGRRLGVGERFVELSAREVRARADLPVFRAGLLQPGNAVLQPARLALGLRRELLARGVRIHERSPVARFTAGPPVIVDTPGGTVTAGQGVLGLGAWTAQVRGYHRAIVPRGTYMVITEPAPERLAALGWTGGEGLADWRTALHYFRPTVDGRVAFGAAAATAGFGTGLGPRLRYDERSMVKLVDDFRRFFPGWQDVRLEAGWGGPMDVTATHQPFFTTLPGGTLHVGAGYTGGGVGPTHLGGKILSALALGVGGPAHRAPARPA